jgi:hypothetical protein
MAVQDLSQLLFGGSVLNGKDLLAKRGPSRRTLEMVPCRLPVVEAMCHRRFTGSERLSIGLQGDIGFLTCGIILQIRQANQDGEGASLRIDLSSPIIVFSHFGNNSGYSILVALPFKTPSPTRHL